MITEYHKEVWSHEGSMKHWNVLDRMCVQGGGVQGGKVNKGWGRMFANSVDVSNTTKVNEGAGAPRHNAKRRDHTKPTTGGGTFTHTNYNRLTQQQE